MDNISAIESMSKYVRRESLSGEGICGEKGEAILDVRTGAGIISFDGD